MNNFNDEFTKIKNNILDYKKIKKENASIYDMVKNVLNKEEYENFQNEMKEMDLEQIKKEILLNQFEIDIKQNKNNDLHQHLFNQFKKKIDEIESAIKKTNEVIQLEKTYDIILENFMKNLKI
jgi:hypothetical protein